MIEPTFPHVVDSSIIAAFKDCQQLAKKVYVDNWKSNEEKIDLHAGAAFAKGMEICRKAFFVDGKSPEEAEALGLAALLEFYGNFECPPDNPKSKERTAGAYEFTMDNYPLTSRTGYPILLAEGRRAIEVGFVHPIGINHPVTGHPILYSGRADMLCQYAGDTYGEDDKTTKQLGPTWSRQWDLRSQFLGYTWGFRLQGYRIAGFLIRGTSILKTKYETQEAIVCFADWEIDRWYGELLGWVEDMVRCWQTGKWKYNFDHACTKYGGCGFRTICKAQDEGPWLRQYFHQAVWDPVLRVETKLEA